MPATNTDILPPADLVLPPEPLSGGLNNQVNTTEEKVINIQHATINVYDVVDISKTLTLYNNIRTSI